MRLNTFFRKCGGQDRAVELFDLVRIGLDPINELPNIIDLEKE